MKTLNYLINITKYLSKLHLNEKIKCHLRHPLCMNANIKKSLKKRSKLRKIFYKNKQRKTDNEKVLEKAT